MNCANCNNEMDQPFTVRNGWELCEVCQSVNLWKTLTLGGVNLTDQQIEEVESKLSDIANAYGLDFNTDSGVI